MRGWDNDLFTAGLKIPSHGAPSFFFADGGGIAVVRLGGTSVDLLPFESFPGA